jgi:hypothetical protein
MEQDLKRIGFFEIENNYNNEVKERFMLYECYKGTFLRIIVSKLNNNSFILEHLYFHSTKAIELQLEFFGTDLSVKNIIDKIVLYREENINSTDMPETY